MQEIDPVCGMSVETNDAQYTAEYLGKTYYFCSASCKTDFEQNPVYYLYGEGALGGSSGAGTDRGM